MASSPPPLTPFDFEPWSDDFNYPDSTLSGNNGWSVSEIGPPELEVITHTLSLSATGDGSNARLDTFLGLAITEQWYLAMTILLGPIGVNTSQTAIWWGNIGAESARIQIDTSTLIGGGHNTTVTIIDAAGTPTAVDILLDGTFPHEFSLRFVGGNLIAAVDGVDTVLAIGAVVNTVTLDSFGVYIDGNVLGNMPAITLVEANRWPEI